MLAADLPGADQPVVPPSGEAITPTARTAITSATSRDAGVLRDAEGLARLTDVLAAVPRLAGRPLDLAAVETTALHTVATLLATAAASRPESRGCHRRTDTPDTRPEWQVRLVHRLDATGELRTRTEPVRSLDLVVA
jgi:L-aspartate oxidase